MERTFKYVLYVDPKPKKRPKVYRWSTVNLSKEDEEIAADAFLEQSNRPETPLNTQLRVQFKFYKNPPKATPKWKLPYMERGYIRPNKSPDLDNYVKLILDALNGLLWEDDRFIVEMQAGKFYTTKKPRIEINLTEIPVVSVRKNAKLIFDEYDGRHIYITEFFDFD